MPLPLSLTTSPNSPYNDTFGDDDLLRYRYRGIDPAHADNVGLRRAMEERVPLVYLHGLMPGRYLAIWPVFVVHDDPGRLTFSVAVDDALQVAARLESALPAVEDDRALLRRYRTAAARTRIHQRAFRERVLHAYREQCAFCRLRHKVLLDAAHIVPDTDPLGEPRVQNGMALCKLHHAAFDRLFLGVTPDYTIQVRRDILDEEDGPMLLHGLQELHGERIVLPKARRLRPDHALIEASYARFCAAP